MLLVLVSTSTPCQEGRNRVLNGTGTLKSKIADHSLNRKGSRPNALDQSNRMTRFLLKTVSTKPIVDGEQPSWGSSQDLNVTWERHWWERQVKTANTLEKPGLLSVAPGIPCMSRLDVLEPLVTTTRRCPETVDLDSWKLRRKGNRAIYQPYWYLSTMTITGNSDGTENHLQVVHSMLTHPAPHLPILPFRRQENCQDPQSFPSPSLPLFQQRSEDTPFITDHKVSIRQETD